jgi:ABC-type polysaccharide/polyol phosphate export permease
VSGVAPSAIHVAHFLSELVPTLLSATLVTLLLTYAVALDPFPRINVLVSLVVVSLLALNSMAYGFLIDSMVHTVERASTVRANE